MFLVVTKIIQTPIYKSRYVSGFTLEMGRNGLFFFFFFFNLLYYVNFVKLVP